MDIFEELFGSVLSEDEVREMIFLRNNGMLKVSKKGDPDLKPNPEKLKVFANVLNKIYELAKGDDEFVVLPPDITPDTAFRIYVEVPDLEIKSLRKDALIEILSMVSVFGVDIKNEETLILEFVIPDVYTY